MNSREVAFNVLMEIEEKESYSNIALNKHLKKIDKDVSPNFVRELVYGVLENQIYLDYMIRKKSKIRLKKIHRKILNILRIGSYQICFLDGTKDYAAVNETVDLVKKVQLNKSVAFVNGILRNMARDVESLKKIDAKDDLDYLSIRYSYPKWLIEKWMDEFGYDFTKELCKASHERARLNVRVNTTRIDRDSLKLKLESQNFIVEKTSYSKVGLIIKNPKNIVDLEEYKKGLFTIQDESSMLVTEVMNPKKSSLVLDVCSAPGGKTSHIAEHLSNTGKVIGRDKYEHKIRLVERTRNRLGLENIKTEIYDGLKLDKDLIGKVDYCLLDGPCSALGTIGRSPEIKYRRSQEDIEFLIGEQRKLLEISSKYVKKGGYLIYSTCTINPDENIKNINWFLENNKDFSLSRIEKSELEGFTNLENGYMEIYPNLHKMDGFFIAKLERVNTKDINMI